MTKMDSNLGAPFIGMLVATMLYGVTAVQTFMFFHDYRIRNQDGWRLQSMVVFLCIYFYVITNFGNFSALAGPTCMKVTSNWIVRSFFGVRVSVLCGHRKVLKVVLPIAINLFSCLSFCSFERLREVSWLLYSSFATAVTADILVAASLCSLLLQNRSGLKRSRTDDIVTFLMAFSINTDLLTSICDITFFITYAVWPDKLIYLGFYFALSKLYINSLLASLNARSSLRLSADAITVMQTGASNPITFPMRGVGASSTSASKDAGIISEMEFA
ncbi:hypothetical protein CPB83DRAFT_838588 [Crepidotus variabilis]|uniref:DUF6534 domain-containing protein n=1 Tax=Crepidotus variabilis TaxID=179855 RepID=A0A9P6E8T1_9AGAR|nr:hypothetical protein CPB83DRAFT_838588 [Crepidotus variabilis]